MIDNSGELKLRSTFKKVDSNPQYYVIDVKKCEILYTEYGYNAKEGMFQMGEGNRIDFDANYTSLRNLLLSDSRVAKLVGPTYLNDNHDQIKKELQYAKNYHAKFPQLNLNQVRKKMDAVETEKLGLTATNPVSEYYPEDLNVGVP